MDVLHGDPVQPEDEKLCVLYDPATGRIIHTHRVTTLPRGRKVDDAEMADVFASDRSREAAR